MRGQTPVQLGILCFAESALPVCQRLHAGGLPFLLLNPGISCAGLAGHTRATLDELLAALPRPRTLWLIEPEQPLPQLMPLLLQALDTGDLIVDAGPTPYLESMRRARTAHANGFAYLDVGLSLNVWAAKYGFALMVGGDLPTIEATLPVLDLLAPLPRHGWLHCGPVGAGAFMRQVQREIETSVLRCLTDAHQTFDPQQTLQPAHHHLAPLWQQGSELRQKLAALAADYLCHTDPDQPFTPFLATAAPDPGLLPGIPQSWPALELARMIQFAADSSQHFERQIMALLQAYPGGFGASPAGAG